MSAGHALERHHRDGAGVLGDLAPARRRSTSMITPPLSISARPLFTRIVPSSAIAAILAVRGAAKNGLDRPQRDRASRRAPARAWSRAGARDPEAEALAPAASSSPGRTARLHRQGEREHRDRERSPQRDGQRPHLVGGESDRRGERGEVRSAAERETGRARASRPRSLRGCEPRPRRSLGAPRRAEPASARGRAARTGLRSARSRPRARPPARRARARTGGTAPPATLRAPAV